MPFSTACKDLLMGDPSGRYPDDSSFVTGIELFIDDGTAQI
jgi:hypothetical protein